MHRRLLFRLWLALIVVLCAGSTSASNPAACTGAHCVYLPLVSTPELVTVTDVGFRGTRFGDDIFVSGEVHVTTSTPVYSVTLEIRTYDSDNRLLVTATGSPVFAATLPGQPNPFDVFVTTGEEYESRVEVSVIEFSRTHPRTFLPVTVEVTSYSFDGTSVRLAGTATNEQTVSLEDVRGAAWIEWGYGSGSQMLATQLAPFETVPFVIGIYAGNGRPGTMIPYKIVAQGVVP